MKRSPLARRKWLQRKTELRHVSHRRRLISRQRRRLVAELLEAYPWCQVCNIERSEHVHELLTRARGGSILDRENCIAVGPVCHRTIHDNPGWAASLGLLRHSWDR